MERGGRAWCSLCGVTYVVWCCQFREPLRDSFAAYGSADRILMHIQDNGNLILVTERENGPQPLEPLGVEHWLWRGLPACPHNAEADKVPTHRLFYVLGICVRESLACIVGEP